MYIKFIESERNTSLNLKELLSVLRFYFLNDHNTYSTQNADAENVKNKTPIKIIQNRPFLMMSFHLHAKNGEGGKNQECYKAKK